MVDRLSTPAAEETGPSVQSVRLRLALVGPLRLASSVIWLVADPALYLDTRRRVLFCK